MDFRRKTPHESLKMTFTFAIDRTTKDRLDALKNHYDVNIAAWLRHLVSQNIEQLEREVEQEN